MFLCNAAHNRQLYCLKYCGDLQEDQLRASAALGAAAMQKLTEEEEQAAAKVAAKKAKKDWQKAKKQQAKQTLDTPALSESAEGPFVDPAGTASPP